MLYLELWQTTWWIIRSIQLKELGNKILHTQFENFAEIQALCELEGSREKTTKVWTNVTGILNFHPKQRMIQSYSLWRNSAISALRM